MNLKIFSGTDKTHHETIIGNDSTGSNTIPEIDCACACLVSVCTSVQQHFYISTVA